MGAVIISPLPPFLLEPLQTAGPLRSADVTPLPRYYRPGRVPLAFHRFPGVTGHTASCSADFATGRGGFLQLLSMTLSPCCPYQPRRSVAPRQSLRRSMLPSPEKWRLGLRTCPFEAIWVHLRYGPATRSPSFSDGFVNRLQNGKFPHHPAIQATGLGLLPRWDLLPLIMPAFAGRTLLRTYLFSMSAMVICAR